MSSHKCATQPCLIEAPLAGIKQPKLKSAAKIIAEITFKKELPPISQKRREIIFSALNFEEFGGK